MQDLKLTFHESSLIFPLQPTQKRSFYLSNIDRMLNYSIPTVYFFAASPDFPPPLAAEKLKLAAQRVLVPYDYMAGRLNLNADSGRLEIDCNSAGAGFVVAFSDFSLHQLGDLVRPNLGFRRLAVQTLDNVDNDNQPLFILQITSFKCGGFSIGLCVNHILLDGMSAKGFNENLASQAFDDKPLAVVPCFDRRLLAARSPPRVSFEHREFFKPDLGPGLPVFDCEREELEYRVFQLSPSNVNFLKEMAAKSSETAANARISSLSAAAALMWKCKALSRDGEYDKERVSNLLNVLDLRSRLQPPLPAEYCGNALLVSYASARCEDIDKLEFSELVKVVAEGPARVTDEYAKSAIDWLEINGGLPFGEYMVSSWLRLGFEAVVFPWGKAAHTGPVVSHRKDICWVFPTVDGVNALVSLPPPEMERFEAHFRKFFSPETNRAAETAVHIPAAAVVAIS
ncbi:hypothetical protein C2S52_023502 [Perilla frutescens var. hirtella]|nr:hypothetical protein C2S52_023502 [Perilla frutescens var. hirtella]